MYKWHNMLSTPPDDKTIWRYMSVTKYIDLLHRKKLFLNRIDKYQTDDPYEGKWTKGWKDSVFPGVDNDFFNIFEKQYFVSCWRLGEYESVAMWKIYCSEIDGVVIKSTIGKLKSALDIDQEQQIHIGKVQYIEDHSKYVDKEPDGGYWGGLGEICKKRKFFSYEDEVRVIEDNSAKKLEYSYANLELDFIEEVRLAPRISEIFIEPIKELSEKFGLSAELIKKSSIYDYLNNK
jgi:hypothetical protein